MREYYYKNKHVVNRALYIVSFLALLYVTVKWLLPYVLPFAVGYLVSAALTPAVNKLEGWKIPRGLAAFVLIIVTMTALVFFGTLGFSRAGREVETLSANLPAISIGLSDMAANVRGFMDNIIAFVPEEYALSFDNMLTGAVTGMADALGAFVRVNSMRVVVGVPNMLIALLMTIFSAYFFLKDGDEIRAAFKKATGTWATRQFSIIRGGLAAAVSGYIRANLILMALIWAVCALGLALLGNPYAILIAAVTAILDALPILGIGFVFWPWTLVVFLMGDIPQAVGLLVIYILAFVIRRLLEPKLIGSQTGVHPLLMLFAIYIGLKVFGVLGLLIGPMAVITLQMALERADP